MAGHRSVLSRQCKPPFTRPLGHVWPLDAGWSQSKEAAIRLTITDTIRPAGEARGEVGNRGMEEKL